MAESVRSWAQQKDDERRAEHMREHLTDGRWHDDCFYCLRRRTDSGTGLEPRPTAADVKGNESG